MSKLSPALKALISAPHARPNTVPASKTIQSVYESIAKSAKDHGVGLPAWLTLSTAATMTMNSPESLLILHKTAASEAAKGFDEVQTAELMREVGLKCISFNGIPRTINMLGAFRAGLPESISSRLSSSPPDRSASAANIEEILRRGRSLWDSVYQPFETKLVEKLAQSHPNLPRVILQYHYGAQLSDPPAAANSQTQVGRVLTSIVAVACLRAQSGVAPQVTSHLFGLRKAYDDGTAEAEPEVQGACWLAGDEGGVWLLEAVDRIVGSVGGEDQGTTFAPGLAARAKL